MIDEDFGGFSTIKNILICNNSKIVFDSYFCGINLISRFVTKFQPAYTARIKYNSCYTVGKFTSKFSTYLRSNIYIYMYKGHNTRNRCLHCVSVNSDNAGKRKEK